MPNTFTLEAQPNTDIWRKPPVKDIFNAPISRTQPGLLKNFQSARITFWADWTERYDQAGLLLTLDRASGGSGQQRSSPERWVKTGIEYYQGVPQLSAVGCDRFADWHVSPLARKSADGTVTLEVVREGDENGKSIWIYQLILDEEGKVKEKQPMREICWFLADEGEGEGKEWKLEVSPLICRPASGTTELLKVEFKDFVVEWLS
ncbi:uncharacterized protein B0I36DRAFT_314682 [Microdochium trichocladiopsis]|uniref:Uncharacterized protein n=1 Tax=Microdochium trichocladiopsis TaxID=1682393 RepID=A0A9P8YF14_9PEZI|nr:uncharacterized protein B0I36DRAFT_314682 [Microdochium trichocladiopsis]KAH7037717.1 hypothetical protein B0I36DRAFT_314682 [Microdochium trichocladiopsis]